MGVARVLALEEVTVGAQDGRSATELGDLLICKVDLCVNAETANDARDRVPGDVDEIAFFWGHSFSSPR